MVGGFICRYIPNGRDSELNVALCDTRTKLSYSVRICTLIPPDDPVMYNSPDDE